MQKTIALIFGWQNTSTSFSFQYSYFFSYKGPVPSYVEKVLITSTMEEVCRPLSSLAIESHILACIHVFFIRNLAQD